MDADAIKVRATVGGGGIGITGGARQAKNVGLDGGEDGQIGGTPKVVKDATNALPAHGDAGGIIRGVWREHGEDGCGIGRVQSSDPVLIDIERGAIQAGVIHRAIGWQTVLLEPGIGDDGRWGLIFVSTHVHDSIYNPRVASEISGRLDICIIACIDAW